MRFRCTRRQLFRVDTLRQAIGSWLFLNRSKCRLLMDRPEPEGIVSLTKTCHNRDSQPRTKRPRPEGAQQRGSNAHVDCLLGQSLFLGSLPRPSLAICEPNNGNRILYTIEGSVQERWAIPVSDNEKEGKIPESRYSRAAVRVLSLVRLLSDATNPG